MTGPFAYLFEDTRWGTVSASFQQLTSPPPLELTSSVNIVPVVGERWLLIRLQDGSYEVPGGTREAGEALLETAARELREEAGAELIRFNVFGAWWCHSARSAPYKPHLPHPDFYRVVGWGEVRLVGAPTNPADGEQVAAVELVTLDQAAARFSGGGRPDLADLYRLAAHVRGGV